MPYTFKQHLAEMPDCDDPDCEYHHPEVLLDEGWTQADIDAMTSTWARD